MNPENEEILEATIVKAEGRPNNPEKPKEQTRWQRFKTWIFPYWKESKELAKTYSQAEVAKKENEARKLMEEAAEIAARKDLTQQKEVKQFNDIIDDIFADDGLLPGAKALKLAKLMEKNPQVAAQLEKVKDIIEKLALKKGLNMEVVDESQKFLPEYEDLEAEQKKPHIRTSDELRKELIGDKRSVMLNKMSIQEVGFSVRVLNYLKSGKIETIGQLVKMTEVDLIKIPGFRKTYMREVKRKLADMNLTLGM
jgi:hypothetical protein